MPVKVQSTLLELRILKTLSNSNKKQLSKLVRVLHPKCFQSPLASEIYTRLMTLARDRGVVIGWDELAVDPALSQTTRKKIESFTKPSIKNNDKLDRSINTLLKYRKMRAMYDAGQHIFKTLQSDKVDADALMLESQGLLNEAAFSQETDSWFIDIGGSDVKARRAIRQLLMDSTANYIPTGLKAFDELNIGIPRGTFFVIQTNSGGGKSVMANQMCGNMAAQGARVCLVPLEMTSDENLRRHVAARTDTDMGKVINTKRLLKSEKRKIERYWMRYHYQIKKSKGLLSIFAPKEDMTIEDILFTLKPRNYDVVIIDYIGLLKGTDGDDQAKKLGAAGRFCKRFADIHNMCIGVCAQLSEDNKVRYSRAINEHSGLSFSWQYDKVAKESHIIKVELPKSRNQNSRPFYMQEQFEFMRFGDIDEKTVEAKLAEQNKEKGKNQEHIRHQESKLTRNKDQKHKEKTRDKELVSEADFIS